jgi:hypothetical protein
MAAVATLGYDKGPSVVFRLNPNDVKWNFTINTSVTPTVGGRVVQVTGATLSDMTVIGSLGEVKAGQSNRSRVSWELHERFLANIRAIMSQQTRDATTFDKMQQPPVFNFPLKGYRFSVYVKAVTDPKGGAISHSPDHFSHEYALTLFIVQDISQDVVTIGKNGVLNTKRQEAINNYITRISDGIGWVASKYNGVGNIAGQEVDIPKGLNRNSPGGQVADQSGKSSGNGRGVR